MQEKTNVAKNYPCSLACVDMAVFKMVDALPLILLARKKDRIEWQLPGGFVDPDKDTNYETAAKRELIEECSINMEVDIVHNIGSFKIKDERYENDKDKVFSTLFVFKYIFGYPIALDDIEEVKWVPWIPSNFKKNNSIGSNTIRDCHRPLIAQLLRKYYEYAELI
tara:strand:+ start:31261 stop:31758 length:498 start_codon:yes stop_codon:yes gene_type:complete